MANEYLKRTPTSTGNRRVFTWSGWVKRNQISSDSFIFSSGSSGSNWGGISLDATYGVGLLDIVSSIQLQVQTSEARRDASSWLNVTVSVDTTKKTSEDRVKMYVNGIHLTSFQSYTVTQNYNTWVNSLTMHGVGRLFDGENIFATESEMCDVFFIDGQALTPDVFGFYKVGKGYVSAGSTQSTDFRPGQWVPKTPRVIKTAINNNGGFGVNGFYLPMNDSNNFGADFHCEPNSIIKLQENLPQPRSRIDGVGDYTGALRDDPFKQYLVLALPFVSGGLNSGFGDYASSIKGSGSAKTITNNTTVSVANTHGYYGSSAYIDSVNYLSSSSADFAMGTGDFTIEGWINQTGGDTTNGGMFSTQLSNGTGIGIAVARDQVWLGNNSTSYGSISATLWPLNQWTHIAVTRSGTTMRVFTNGVCSGITTTATGNIDRQNAAIGRRYFDNSSYTPIGYLQDLRVYKGVAKYTGGFDVPRPYTPVGIATWRAVPDSPANNFATWNPAYPVIAGSNAAYTNGNLTIAEPTSNNSQGTATIGVSTGKWYYEAFPSNVTTASHLIGIRPAEWFTDNAQNRTAYRSEGSVYNDSATTVQSGTTYTSSDIIGVAFDMNTKQLWFSKNGSWVYSGNPSGGSNQAVSFASTYSHYTPMFCFDNVAGTQTFHTNFGQNPTFSGNTTAGTYTDSNNKGLFKYQPPSGFLALCEDNLPTPAISDPGKYFKTVLYTGDGNSGRSITGVGFQPDFVWIKARTIAYNHRVFDSVRGAGKDNFLLPNSTAVEGDSGNYYGGISSFDADGFSMVYGTGGSNIGINASGENYVAWCWRAGAGTTSTNTNGSITSVVSVNQDAGFSIVSYTGNATASTVGHGLGKAPAFIIVKGRTNAVDWQSYHKSLGINYTTFLNLTNASNNISNYWGSSNPTSTNFGITGSYSGVNSNGVNYIAYCWAEIEGFSKFGSYVGNGSTDGPFVYCGFRPAWVMIKNISGTHNWEIYDSSMNPINPVGLTLLPNASDAQIDTTPRLDFLSNGFKWRNIGGSVNGSGNTIIFAAYAESPFQTANAK